MSLTVTVCHACTQSSFPVLHIVVPQSSLFGAAAPAASTKMAARYSYSAHVRDTIVQTLTLILIASGAAENMLDY